MNSRPVSRHPAGIEFSLSQILDPIYDFVERYFVTVTLLLTLVYLAVTLWIARKPLNHDEIGAQLVAGAPTAGDVITALKHGADLQPPLFEFLIRPVALSRNELLMRLPGIAGVWLMAACICAFVSYRLSRVHGLIAALLCLLSPAGPFHATEGAKVLELRPYGIVLGCSAAAMLCWQRLPDARNRAAVLFGLWFFAAMAVANHYYGLLILIPLGIGELIRWRIARRLDVAASVVICAAVLPLLPAVPIARAVKALHMTYWSHAGSGFQTFQFFSEPFATAFVFLLIAGVALFTFLPESLTTAEVNDGAGRQTMPDIGVILAFALLPVAGVVLGKLAGGFAHRYVTPTALGISALAAYALPRKKAFLTLAVAIIGLCLAIPVRDSLRQPMGLPDFSSVMSPYPQNLPIVFSSPKEYITWSYYAPQDIAARMVCLEDKKLSLQYLNEDAIEWWVQAMDELRLRHMTDYHAYLAQHPRFLLVDDKASDDVWTTYDLVKHHARLQPLSDDPRRTIYEVDAGTPGI